jgi:hypothetical protein
MNQNLFRLDNPLEQFQSSMTPHSQRQVVSKRKGNDPSFTISLQSLPRSHRPLKVPSLPKVQSNLEVPEATEVNSTPATNFLKEIEAKLVGRQQELRQVVQQIQALYAEGPILDGWLESQQDSHGDELQVQKAQRDRDFSYVEEICDENVSYQTPRTGYHLCGFDENGQPWSRPCPPEQVASVRVAIARYQKIRELLERKSTLENRLGQLSETLAVVHHNLPR